MNGTDERTTAGLQPRVRRLENQGVFGARRSYEVLIPSEGEGAPVRDVTSKPAAVLRGMVGWDSALLMVQGADREWDGGTGLWVDPAGVVSVEPVDETLSGALAELVNLLVSNGETRWAHRFSTMLADVDSSDRSRHRRGVRAVLFCYGGLGSFADLALTDRRGYPLPDQDRLFALQQDVWRLGIEALR